MMICLVSISGASHVYDIFTMKSFQSLLVLGLAAVAAASPTPDLAKRAAYSDPCNIGYCTQNGGCVPPLVLVIDLSLYLY